MKSRIMAFASAALLVSAPAVFAQEEEVAEETSEATSDASTSDTLEKTQALVKQQKQSEEKPFHMLPLCRLLEGGAEVMRPGAKVWEPLEEGRFYPLGCSYRTATPASRLTIQFGPKSEVCISGVASFGTRMQQVGLKDRTVILKSGEITVSLPRNMPTGLFKVAAPGFTVTDLAGDSTYTYEGTGDGDSAVVRCVTGTISVEGRHFKIPAMHAANEIRIRTSQDLLFTGLYGLSGDSVVKLEQGSFSVHDVETNTDKREDRVLDFRLTPKTAVRLHRAVPKVGSRMSVTVMTFDETGALVNRCAFAEGLPELSTGEQGEKALAAKEEDAKRAMESADVVTTEAAPEDTETEEASTEEETESTDTATDTDTEDSSEEEE